MSSPSLGPGRMSREYITRTLAFAGLLQMAHELIKTDVVDNPKSTFFGGRKRGNGSWEWDDGDARWRRDVLALDPKNSFRASLRWLEGMGALTREQSDSLERVMAHWDELTHEMAGFLFRSPYVPDLRVLRDAVDVFDSLDWFWIRVHLDMGMCSHLRRKMTEADVENVAGIVLRTAISAFHEQFPEQ